MHLASGIRYLVSRMGHGAWGMVFLFLSFPAFSQFSAGPDDTINPGVPVTLTATYGLIGNGVTISDDGVEGPLPIGFPFSFFGDIYNQFYIGANGWISFIPNVNAAGTRQAFAVPNAADYNPKACILAPFQDLNPLIAGSPYIYYLTVGDSTQKKLVVMWCQTPMYSCLDSAVTFQVILNYGSNTIENHILSKPSCDWLSNLATLGVQNPTGYIGYAVPGRNGTSWTAQQEGWRYTPTSIDSFQIASIPFNLEPIVPGEKITYSWYKGTELLSTQQSLTVTPDVTTTYWAKCVLCDGQEFTDSVTVYVIPYIPNAFTPNGDGTNDMFRIIGLPPENITKFNMQIFNRWGEVVFSTDNILEGWDGRFNRENCPAGNYVWVIFYEDQSKITRTNKGVVALIR